MNHPRRALTILPFLPFLVVAGPFPTWSFQHSSSRIETITHNPIQVSTKETLAKDEEYDCIVVGIPGEACNDTAANLGRLFHALDAQHSGILSRCIRDGTTPMTSGKTSSNYTMTSFSSPLGEMNIIEHPKRKQQRGSNEWEEVKKVCVVSLEGRVRFHRLVLLRFKDCAMQDARKLGRSIGNQFAPELEQTKGQKWALLLPPPAPPEDQTRQSTSHWQNEVLAEMTTTLWCNLYKNDRLKTDTLQIAINPSKTPISLDLIWDHAEVPPQTTTSKQWKESIARGECIASGIFLAKDIVNSPHDVLSSLTLADIAKRMVYDSPRLYCQILNAEDCEKLGMGAFLGVSRGAETPPQFIHVIYRPPGGTRKGIRKIGIVGKGMFCDTGGYTIKRGDMEFMRFDCGGAAAVLGAAKAIALLKPKHVEVHFVVAACENKVNDRAMVPGDVLTASNGKTIEIVNTDAEGRLSIADALVYVDEKLGCKEILELSTLTSSCMDALGQRVAGLWCKSDAMAASLISASATTGEKVWSMPFQEEYKEGLKSQFADLNNGNTWGKDAAATAAALFLQEFVGEDKPFAHIDMAGPVWAKTGATGWGVKLITEWVCQISLRQQSDKTRDIGSDVDK